jgi:beta-fructofuranosidase
VAQQLPVIDPFVVHSQGYFGDTFPIFWRGACHLFALRSDCGGVYHLVSEDLVHWEERPLAIDHWAATGTVVHHEGHFYMFYTGHPQRVHLAVSDDLDHWTDHPDNPILEADGVRYPRDYFRDPYVFFHEGEQTWWMLLGSQYLLGRPRSAMTGCVALAKSSDLWRWRLQDPLWAPGIHPHCDCPQLSRIGERWYLLYLARQTRYRVADDPAGPFERPPARDLYTRLAAAGSRPAFDGRRWIAWPLVFHKTAELGEWLYGGPLAIPRQIDARQDGVLVEQPLPEMVRAMRALPEPDTGPLSQAQVISGEWSLPGLRQARCEAESGGALLLAPLGPDLYVEMDVLLGRENMEAHVLLRTDTRLERGYKLGIYPRERRISLRQNDVLANVICSRPVTVDTSAPVNIKLFMCGSILEVFVGNQTSLTERLYDFDEGRLALYVRDGRADFKNITVRELSSRERSAGPRTTK